MDVFHELAGQIGAPQRRWQSTDGAGSRSRISGYGGLKAKIDAPNILSMLWHISACLDGGADREGWPGVETQNLPSGATFHSIDITAGSHDNAAGLSESHTEMLPSRHAKDYDLHIQTNIKSCPSCRNNGELIPFTNQPQRPRVLLSPPQTLRSNPRIVRGWTLRSFRTAHLPRCRWALEEAQCH